MDDDFSSLLGDYASSPDTGSAGSQSDDLRRLIPLIAQLSSAQSTKLPDDSAHWQDAITDANRIFGTDPTAAIAANGVVPTSYVLPASADTQQTYGRAAQPSDRQSFSVSSDALGSRLYPGRLDTSGLQQSPLNPDDWTSGGVTGQAIDPKQVVGQVTGSYDPSDPIQHAVTSALLYPAAAILAKLGLGAGMAGAGLADYLQGKPMPPHTSDVLLEDLFDHD